MKISIWVVVSYLSLMLIPFINVLGFLIAGLPWIVVRFNASLFEKSSHFTLEHLRWLAKTSAYSFMGLFAALLMYHFALGEAATDGLKSKDDFVFLSFAGMFSLFVFIFLYSRAFAGLVMYFSYLKPTGFMGLIRILYLKISGKHDGQPEILLHTRRYSEDGSKR